MKKIIGIIFLVCSSIFIFNGFISKNAKNSLSQELNELPVMKSTALYPEFTIPSLTEKADYIIQAKVMEVGDTLKKEMPVSFTENPKEATETISYPITPITLKINNVIKGDILEDTLIYYEDGGKTSEYIQVPDGYFMKEGMDIILFLNKDGYCFGGQSMFPVINNQVLLNKMALNYVNSDQVSEIETKKITSVFKEQISNQTVSFMKLEDFITMIKTV